MDEQNNNESSLSSNVGHAAGNVAASAVGGAAGRAVYNLASKIKGVEFLESTFGKLVIFILTLMLLAILFGLFIPIFIILDLSNSDNNDSTSISSNNNSSCSYTVNGKNISNVKVKLLSCEGTKYLEDEELIDFEDYITGIVYQEVGEISMEAMKVQAVVARSFALTRPKEMGSRDGKPGTYGVNLEEKDGQWILSLRSCTNDQVFCNPNKGCWSNVTGGQTNNNNPGGWANCTVHSGYDTSKTWSNPPLSEDSPIREAVKATEGQVYVDGKGEIIYTDFVDTNQKKWESLAKSGKDYVEILAEDYGIGNVTSPNCSSDSSSIESSAVQELIALNQSDAWKKIIGKSSTENHPSVSQSTMNGRVSTITVPVRVWNSGKGADPVNDTEKGEWKITVNSALVELWKAFFEDVYNNADDFVFNKSDTGAGCYNYRNITSGGSLSPHAYGVACDLNPSTTGNGYGVAPYSKQKWESLPNTRTKYQTVYKESKIVQIAHKYTLINGSDWNNANDAMHFSFIGDWDRSEAIACKDKKVCK